MARAQVPMETLIYLLCPGVRPADSTGGKIGMLRDLRVSGCLDDSKDLNSDAGTPSLRTSGPLYLLGQSRDFT